MFDRYYNTSQGCQGRDAYGATQSLHNGHFLYEGDRSLMQCGYKFNFSPTVNNNFGASTLALIS